MSLTTGCSSWCAVVVSDCGEPWRPLGTFHLRFVAPFIRLSVLCGTLNWAIVVWRAEVTVAMGWYHYNQGCVFRNAGMTQIPLLQWGSPKGICLRVRANGNGQAALLLARGPQSPGQGLVSVLEHWLGLKACLGLWLLLNPN